MVKERIRVLAYHDVNDVENFERQIKYLKDHYTLISFGNLVAGQVNEKQPVLLTFDDIDRSVYTNAFPILKKYNVPAIVFVVTGLINTKMPFWWDEVLYHLGQQDGNKKNWELKDVPNKERLKFLDELRDGSIKPKLEYKQLKVSELKEMAAAGIVVANHSHTHPMYDQCTTEELYEETSLSFKILKDLEFSPDIFAYPNGNFSRTAEQILLEEGIKYAFLFDHKINKGINNPLRISRLSVNDSTSLLKFKFILSGLHSKVLPITKFVGKIKSQLKNSIKEWNFVK